MAGRTRLRALLTIGALAATGAPALAAPDACDSLTPAAVGGPLLPAASDTVVVRWLGNANYEVTFGGKVFLFDAYFDRVARSRPIGFAVPDVRKADAILVSHAHFDHISDIGPVARQTGATVVGAPITIETAIKLGVPAHQTKVVNSGVNAHLDDAPDATAPARHG